jgi:hypothetical protein
MGVCLVDIQGHRGKGHQERETNLHIARGLGVRHLAHAQDDL